MEAALVAALGLYLLAVIVGRRENLRLAKEWSKAIADPESGVLPQQFSYHGYIGLDTKDRDAFYWRDGPSTFKFWGSGRRNCVGVLFTVETPPHHDFVKRLLPGQFDSRLGVEVWMSEGAMAPMVLAAGPPKALRQLAKSNDDLKDFTKRIDVARDRAPGWPAGGPDGGRELAVHAESAGLFYDILGDPRALAALTREPEVLKHLRSMFFSTEGGATPKLKLQFTFGLPGPGQMDELKPGLALVFTLIDLVTAYKPTPEAASKAAALREKVAEARAERRAKEEGGAGGRAAELQAAAQQRRLEKIAEERERARRQGPKALEKFEEKLRKQQMKKQMKRQTVKMG